MIDLSFCLLLFSNALGNDPTNTRVHPAPAPHRGNSYNYDNNNKMGGPKFGISVDALCPYLSQHFFLEKQLGNEPGAFCTLLI